MIKLSVDTKIYLSNVAVDLRKNIDGLSMTVLETLDKSPQSDSIFISNNMTTSAERLHEVCHKRWRIEEYHKSVKQNANLVKSPTKTVTTQCNHVFAAIIAYCKLEF